MSTLVLGYPRLLARELALAAHQRGQSVLVLVPPAELARAEQELAVHGIELLAGVATALDFGLSGVLYNDLRRRVTQVHHVTPRGGKGLRSRIVASTREFLELLRSAPSLERAVHHSSVQVFGERTGWIAEDAPIDPSKLHNGKEVALALAETMVTRELGRLPLCIARAAFLAGHSQTGETELDSGIYLVALLGLAAPSDLRLPFPGRGEWQLNLVPVDWVAQMGVLLANAPRATHGRFHLVDPSPFAARQVLERVLQLAAREAQRHGGRSGRFLPAGFTRALLRAPGLEPLVRSPRAFFEAWLRDVTFSSLQTNAVLADQAPLCPPLDGYLERVVARAAATARHGAEREPEPVEDTLLA